nr:hypothetical protein L204_03667 [Cryptococcus depauperatus CBS 7855]
MSSLQIGSSDGSHGLTQHSPSQSHLPAPSTFSQTRKRRQVTKSNSSAILTDYETPSQPSVTNADWHNDGTDQVPSSLSLLLDWLSITGNYDSLKGKGSSKPQDGYKRTSNYLKERGCTTSSTSSAHSQIIRLHSNWTKAKDWKNRSGNGQGQCVIHHAPVSRRADAERDALGNVRMTYSEWDILDPIFSDRDEISCHKDRRKRMNRRLKMMSNPEGL